MRNIIQDVRYVARLLMRSPGITAIAVLALALGTGANAAIFSVVYAAFLRPLPLRHVERLVTMAMSSEKLRVNAAQPGFSTYAKYVREGRSFESVAAAVPGTATFAGEGDTTIKFWRVSARG